MNVFDRPSSPTPAYRIPSIRVALMAVAVILAAPLAAADAGWQLKKDKDGIQIHSRAVAGWEINEIRSSARIDARLSSIVAVITDVSAAHELTDIVASSEILRRDSDTRSRIYSVMKMPWPVSNRDILADRQISQDRKTRVVTITNTAVADGLPPKKDLVRIVKSRQQWTLTPLPQGGVHAELLLLADPNGPIPASVINAMSVGTPFKSMGQLKAMAQRPKYANASLPFIAEPPTP